MTPEQVQYQLKNYICTAKHAHMMVDPIGGADYIPCKKQLCCEAFDKRELKIDG